VVVWHYDDFDGGMRLLLIMMMMMLALILLSVPNVSIHAT
jgi:hypothetical protein